MKSHTCPIPFRPLLKTIGLPLLPVLLFALGIRLAASLQLLPPPFPALDMDRAILLHQAQAAATDTNATLLLVGDSSCLMDVDARALSSKLPNPPALNLGTLSYMDLDGYALLLKKRLAARPTSVKTVLLLMHPEALRLGAPEPFYSDALRHFYSATDHCEPSASRVLCALGVNIARARLLSRLFPIALPGENGHTFGFTDDLQRILSANQGSLHDPRQFDPLAAQGNAEYRLSDHARRTSERFRSAIPDGVQLVVGVTPAPASFVQPNHSQTVAAILAQWASVLRADRALTNLPTTMPDHLFASPTHLNAAGRQIFTGVLAQNLLAAD